MEEETAQKEPIKKDKIDFDSDSIKDVQEHKTINIHNVHSHNKSITDNILCDFCEYTTNDSRKMVEHSKTNHGSFKCKKCEYSALDK